MDRGRVLHAAHEGVHVLRFLGEIRYPLVPSVNRYVDHLLIREVPSAFVIDLTETSAIDSTSLGALGRIANRMREVGGPRVTLLSTRPDINEVLISSAFDQVFDLVPESALAGGEGQELPIEEADREGLRRTVLEAHRVLMALSERNRGLFRDLVAALEAEGGKDPSCP